MQEISIRNRGSILPFMHREELLAFLWPSRLPASRISSILTCTILEDILGREPVRVDLAAMAGYLAGEVILVTGAGGSIGCCA
ncbi:hypothetical protein MTMBA_06710 [Moorella thermoacetica]